MTNGGTKNSIYNIVEKMLGKERIQERKYLRKKEKIDNP